jgi:hypothetical protein
MSGQPVPQRGLGPEICTELNVGPHTCNLVSSNEGRIHKRSLRINIYLNAFLESPVLTLIQSTNIFSGIFVNRFDGLTIKGFKSNETCQQSWPKSSYFSIQKKKI